MDYDIITVEVITLKNNPYDNQREAVLLAYLAGIIDGEGSIGITKVTPKRYTNPRYTARILLANVNREVMELFSNTFGGTISEERVPNRQLVYRWRKVGNPIVKEVLTKISPYLIIKRKQAETVLEFANSSMAASFPRNQGVPVEELRRREDFYLKLKELNAVGAPATTNRRDTGDGEVIV